MSGAKWRMKNPCENCPFNNAGPGYVLRVSLGGRRWRQILRLLRHQMPFVCHKTTRASGDGSELVCAGSLAWCDKHGVSSNLQRVMERLDAIGELQS
jgi:hypothetical protein